MNKHIFSYLQKGIFPFFSYIGIDMPMYRYCTVQYAICVYEKNTYGRLFCRCFLCEHRSLLMYLFLLLLLKTHLRTIALSIPGLVVLLSFDNDVLPSSLLSVFDRVAMNVYAVLKCLFFSVF